jgi:DNA repair photolyase
MSKIQGTKQWSPKSRNIQVGCEHNCKYCYGRTTRCRINGKFHLGWQGEGTPPIPYDPKTVVKNTRIMFPSTHDITALNIDRVVSEIRNLLSLGNEILIVSKPHLPCIQRLCAEFTDSKDKILFRFSMATDKPELLKFWETDAPEFEERFACLKFAKAAGYQTSVSCEPLLDVDGMVDYVTKIEPFVTHSIWVGLMGGDNKLAELENKYPIETKTLLEQYEQSKLEKLWKDLINKFGNKILAKDRLADRLLIKIEDDRW